MPALVRLRLILTSPQTDQLELLMGLCYLGWAIALAWPTATLLRGPAYQPMSQITGGHTWPYILLCAANGIVKFWGLFSRRERIRAFGGGMGTVMWLLVATNFAVSRSVVTGLFVYGAFAMTCSVIMFNHIRSRGSL